MHFDSLENKLIAELLRNCRRLIHCRFLHHKKAVQAEKISVAAMKRMIDAFPEPLNDYDRCYQQYQCYEYYRCAVGQRSKVGLFFLHCAGIIAIPFFLSLYALKRLSLKPSASCSAILIQSNDALGNVFDYSAWVPRELKEEFPDLKGIRQTLYPPLNEGVLGLDALKVWLGMVIRHPLKGYLNLMALSYIMFANQLLLRYHPKALLVAREEVRYTSSIVTMLCERHGCELILLMHGDLFVNIKTAFVRFSRAYIWDEHYRDIFLWSRGNATRYIVAQPDGLSLPVVHTLGEVYRYDICYYMSGNTDYYPENLESIKNALVTLSENGLRVKIRPHPRWSDMKMIQRLFDGFDIEQASEKTLSDSISETRWILGTFSTVLLQAFYAGKTVVLDDVSNPAYFSKLEEFQYIMVKKPHLLLSELLRRNQEPQKGA